MTNFPKKNNISNQTQLLKQAQNAYNEKVKYIKFTRL